MKKHQRNRSEAYTAVRAVVEGVGTSLLLLLMLSAVVAWLISEERLQESVATIAVPIVQALSAFAGGFLVSLLARSNRVLLTSVSGVLFAVVLACMNIIFMDGTFGNMGTGLLCIAAGTLCALVVSATRGNKRGHKRRIRIP